MNVKNETKIIEAFQTLILSIASVFFVYSLSMLVELMYKYL